MARELTEHEIKAMQDDLKERERLLGEILAIAGNLPPFPDVVWKVMSLIRKVAPPEQIEAVVKYDQAITSRILQVSRSAYYGRQRRINSLRDAVLTLGNEKLVQVILVASASGYFETATPGYHANERRLWEHSVASAIMGEKVALHLGHRKDLSIYTACLLHDIGKVVRDLYIETHSYPNLRQLAQEDKSPLEDERRIMGIDHQELGEIIARQWRFPQGVAVAIGAHHTPDAAASDRDIAAIVYASNRMTIAMDADRAEEKPLVPEEDHVFKALGIDSRTMAALQSEVMEAMAEVKTFLTT